MKLSPIVIVKQTPQDPTYDEAGTQVTKAVSLPSVLPPYAASNLPPHFLPRKTHAKVCPLAFFCIRSLSKSLELGERDAFLFDVPNPIPYPTVPDDNDSDLLSLLIPHMHRSSRAVRMKYVDPRLWITLVRIFWSDTLPSTFLKFAVPLADNYLPYIQFLDPTETFTLLVVLNLRGKSELDDDSIIALKGLHQLAVLDCGQTGVTVVGIKRLSGALRFQDYDGNADVAGPWRLRTLSLRGCQVDDTVALSLPQFPLLCVVDLRDTRCTARPMIQGWHDILPAEEHTDLFHPAPPSDYMSHLGTLAKAHQRQLFPCTRPPYSVIVDTLAYQLPPKVRSKHLNPGADGARWPPYSNRYPKRIEPGFLGSTDTLFRSPSVQDPDEDEDKDDGTDEERKTDEERRLALESARISAYQEHTAFLKCREVDTRVRGERNAIEYSRKPSSLTTRELLNRQLMLIRVPPSYDELGTKIKRMEQSARVKEMIKKAQEDEKKKGPKSGEEIMATDKKRRVEQTTMWDEILRGTQKKTKPSTSTSSESGSTAKRSQNPYSKRPSSNISKVVRPG